MSDYGQANGLPIQSLGRRRPADSTAVLGAGMFGYGCGGLHRAFRIDLTNPLRKLPDVGEVQLRPALRLPKASLGPGLSICQTLDFGLLEGWFLDQDSLPFIAFASFAPLQDNGR